MRRMYEKNDPTTYLPTNPLNSIGTITSLATKRASIAFLKPSLEVGR
jgi:hypothetical protein